jgi:hypothetical protein
VGARPVCGVVEESAHEEEVLEEGIEHQFRGADVVVPPVLQQERGQETTPEEGKEEGVEAVRKTSRVNFSPKLPDGEVRTVGRMSSFIPTDPHTLAGSERDRGKEEGAGGRDQS